MFRMFLIESSQGLVRFFECFGILECPGILRFLYNCKMFQICFGTFWNASECLGMFRILHGIFWNAPVPLRNYLMDFTKKSFDSAAGPGARFLVHCVGVRPELRAARTPQSSGKRRFGFARGFLSLFELECHCFHCATGEASALRRDRAPITEQLVYSCRMYKRKRPGLRADIFRCSPSGP